MYKNTTLAILLAISLVGLQTSSAVEESATFNIGDKWAFGHEIDIMDEIAPEISEINIEGNQAIVNGEAKDNITGMEVLSFDFDNNKAVMGYYYTGEVIDDFDDMYHIQAEQALYSHTVIDNEFTGTFIPEGTHEAILRCEASGEEEDEDCQLLDNATSQPFALEELTVEIGGEMHMVAKILQDTWWTQDDFELQKTEFTVSLGASSSINVKNVPNVTASGWDLLSNWREDLGEECHDGNGNEVDCETGEPVEHSAPFQDCEEDNETNITTCYDIIDVIFETLVVGMSAEASVHLVLEFAANEPMNVLNLPLKENDYWEGTTNVTIAGDIGGMVDVKKPQFTICPDLDCDKLPEMQELYSGLTDAIQEFHDNDTIDITVDRDNDGLPDVITEWNDIFPMYIPELWMDDIFKRIADEVACEDNDPECDETSEEEYDKLNLRIENNRFAFGPYSLPAGEEGLPYAFETGEKQNATASDGTSYEGYEVFPTDECSDNNPDEDACSDDDEGDDGGIEPFSNHEDDCEGDPFCDSEIIWFHDAETGRPAYINMEMPNLGEEGHTMEITSIEPALAETQIEANADAENPEKSTITPEQASISKPDEDLIPELPGFGIMAAGASLLFVSRRFRS